MKAVSRTSPKLVSCNGCIGELIEESVTTNKNKKDKAILAAEALKKEFVISSHSHFGNWTTDQEDIDIIAKIIRDIYKKK